MSQQLLEAIAYWIDDTPQRHAAKKAVVDLLARLDERQQQITRLAEANARLSDQAEKVGAKRDALKVEAGSAIEDNDRLNEECGRLSDRVAELTTLVDGYRKALGREDLVKR